MAVVLLAARGARGTRAAPGGVYAVGEHRERLRNDLALQTAEDVRTIEADLGNVALLRRLLRVTAPSQDAGELLAELRERVAEELDYRIGARNQQMFADFYSGHPTIHVPRVVGELSARRVLTSRQRE